MRNTGLQITWESSPEGFQSPIRTPPPALRDKRLFQEFSTTGEFWLPSEPDRRLWGSLDIKAGGRLRVTLDGSLFVQHGGSEISPETLQGRRVVVNALHGQIFNGTMCTLLEGMAHTDTYFAEEPRFRSHVTARYLLSGGLYATLDDCLLSSLLVGFSHLNDWFESPHKMQRAGSDSDTMTISYEPTSFEVPLAFEGKLFALRPFCGRSISTAPSNALIWAYSYKLDLRPQQSQSLRWFLDLASHLRACLAFLIGAGVYTLELDGKTPHALQIFLPVDVPSVVQLDSEHFATRYRLIEGDLPRILTRWFERHKELLVVTRGYSEVLLNDGAYVESIFLQVVQLLEHFHGILMPDQKKYLAKSTWRSLLGWLRSQLAEWLQKNADVSSETATIQGNLIADRLGPLNTLSFRSRLEQLFRQMPARELNPVMGNPANLEEAVSAFLKSVEATRNYLTHHSEMQADLVVSGERLEEAVFRCWAVLSFWLAKCLDLSDEVGGDIAMAAKRAMFLVSRKTGL